MLKYIFYSTAAIIVFILISSCSKSNNGVSLPNPVYFVILKDGDRLPDAVLNAVKVSYINQEGEKKYNSYFDFVKPTRYIGETNEENKYYTYGTLAIPPAAIIASADERKIKEYTIEYPDGSVGNLYVDYKAEKESRSSENGYTFGYTVFKLKQIKYNGKMIEKTTYKDLNNIFVFNKN